MLYYLFDFLENSYNLTGASLFQFISFRGAFAIILSLFISTIFGKKIIGYLIYKNVGEDVRQLGLDGENDKKGTPTMGGLIIIISTLIPVFLLSKLDNIYIQVLIISTIWMGTFGFVDDYIKIFKKNKKGLKGRFKVLGQFILGVFVGLVMYFHPDITIRKEKYDQNGSKILVSEKSTLTTIPFLKNNELDYSEIIFWDKDSTKYSWIIFVPIVILIIISVSNGANITDGIDGLAAGTSAIIILTLGIFSWISGNIIFSNYLNIMYIPNLGEIVIYICSMLGALIGFLWFNAFPAQIFMGDTGSLTIGAIISVIAIMVRKELLLPLLCGIFLIENLSVIIQVFYYKYSKKKTGFGKRVFLMAPIHHHFQKKGMHESKIVSRFWIIGIILSVLTIVTLKLR
ncbi:MAG: phospho-N-acetylmuramoyl-pentapeptide-transferase [Bacteroidota bacterium]|nr:phospho-N-acetylmuramoyl-pentapeptide-transferase [Flavobacteriaceae bacterium]MEC8616030.1 phospho-N-acetylmuramoyl-pentapeptide-transferase [Bacteroidota bacterium]|tara:strand:- start:8069 stop:9268 length:1200 start_codon:yes stop_codon:yes gene_type:complete